MSQNPGLPLNLGRLHADKLLQQARLGADGLVAPYAMRGGLDERIEKHAVASKTARLVRLLLALAEVPREHAVDVGVVQHLFKRDVHPAADLPADDNAPRRKPPQRFSRSAKNAAERNHGHQTGNRRLLRNFHRILLQTPFNDSALYQIARAGNRPGSQLCSSHVAKL